MTEYHPTWRTSSYSGEQGDCVQVAVAAGRPEVPVRDTKHDAAGPVLFFPRESWEVFVASLH